jgi:peroxiredoxin
MARTKALPVPEVGAEAPEFYLPSAQGGQLRLSMRTARGPVVVVFYSGGWSAEDVAYFKDLAAKEDEINLAEATIVGVGIGEFASARDFARETGIKSYVLYDYTGVATRGYGLLDKDEEHGEYARPATFIVDSGHKVVQAWIGERPKVEEILARVSEITGFPKPVEEAEGEEKPEKTGERKRRSPEEREKRRAGREDEAKGKSDGESGNRSEGG